MRIAALAIVAGILAAGCNTERRDFEKPRVKPSDIAQADAQPALQPGKEGPGMKAIASAGGYNETAAYEVSQGKTLFRWFNCVGCHAQGGGAIGPALMDDKWIYGKEPDDIFTTIMDGRPNGMPSFRGRIPEAQAWQIVAYVRSMSGQLGSATAPGRTDSISPGEPEAARERERPVQTGTPQPR